MSLVPIIQPPIMRLLTTEKERKIKMEQLRPVSKLEKILFPIIITIVVSLILPTTAPLVGMLMLGNLFKESGVVRQLTETASNALMYIVVILLGTSVGATTSAEAFLNLDTIKIVVLGLVAFTFPPDSLHINLPNSTPAAVPNANATRPNTTILIVSKFKNASSLVVAPTEVPSKITTMYINAL